MIGTAAFVLSLGALGIDFLLSQKKKRLGRLLSAVLCGAAGLLLLFELIKRTLIIGFPALTSTYESLMFFSLVLLISGFLLRLKSGFYRVYRGILSLTLLFLVLASSPLFPGEPHPPVPALRSGWLVLHVTFAFMGEALFAMAFFGSLVWFFSTDPEYRKRVDLFIYRSILGGYPLFTLGALIFGMIWAASAWGSFWSWDPKETWALVTWLTYTWYLHARVIAGKSPKITNTISLLGFLFTMITFLGVRYISFAGVSLHSY